MLTIMEAKTKQYFKQVNKVLKVTLKIWETFGQKYTELKSSHDITSQRMVNQDKISRKG